MKVIVEPRFPVRGILAGPINKPMRLDLSPMQIKRCILSDAKVYEETEAGKKKEISLNDVSEYAGRSTVVKLANAIVDSYKEGVKDPAQTKEYNGAVTLKEGALVEGKKDIPQQAPVDPYKGMTKAERRRARREAEQRAAEAAKAVEAPVEDPVPVAETAEEASLEEVSAEQVAEEVNNTFEEVEQSAEEVVEEKVEG